MADETTTDPDQTTDETPSIALPSLGQYLGATLKNNVVDPKLFKELQDDWSVASQRFQQAINAGYDVADAKAMYLDPAQLKWDTAKGVPSSLRAQSNSDFDKASDYYLQDIKAGYENNEAAGRRLLPVQTKWSTAGAAEVPASKPETAAQASRFMSQSPVMQAEDSQAKNEIASGQPVTSVINRHPTLIQNAPYSSLWKPLYESALNREQTAEEKAVRKTASEAELSTLQRRYSALPAKMATEDALVTEERKKLAERIATIKSDPDAPTEQLTEGVARELLQQANGDKAKARELATSLGYEF